MRAGLIAAAFAATAIAVPLAEKRAVEVVTNTDVEVVYATVYTTVTGGEQEATPAAASPKKQYGGNHWGHNPWWGGKPNKGHDHPKQSATTTTYEASWEPSPTKTAAPETTTSEAPQPTETSTGPSGGYQATVINQHNLHRKNHSAPDIAWDSTLAANAAKVAASCVYAHNTDIGNTPQGQNIAAGVDASGIDKIITNMFYNNEVSYYDGYYGMDQPPMDNFEHWGHFSQIVWKSTTHVGCATQECPGGLANVGSNVPPVFTVCNYATPGNFANEYGANVLKPIGEPTVTAD